MFQSGMLMIMMMMILACIDERISGVHVSERHDDVSYDNFSVYWWESLWCAMFQSGWFFSSWDEDVNVPVDEESEDSAPISTMNQELLAKAESHGL